MERLTYINGKEWEIKGVDGTPCDEMCENRFLSGCHDCPIQTAFDRLAAYEDTGLSPETVSELLKRSHSFYHTVDGLDLVDPVHFGAFLDRVLRWCQAEKDGRLVVLPCKKGDTLWSFYNHIAKGLCEIVVTAVSTLDGITVINTDNYGVIPEKDIGKTVFLTREEAEAALKKREEANDEAD